MFRTLHYSLLPGNCLLCALPSRRRMDLCEVCEQRLPWNLRACEGCALPLDAALTRLCDQCQNHPLAFEYACAPFLYRDEIAKLLTHGKFGTGFSSLALLSELCATHFAEAKERPDLLIPVPLSWRRTMARGFNQSALLARGLGKQLDIPVRYRVLRRRRHTCPQSGLSRRARLRNLAGAFEARQTLSGRTVALVDDVMTTGATALAATKVLKKAGASRVLIWGCARTPDTSR